MPSSISKFGFSSAISQEITFLLLNKKSKTLYTKLGLKPNGEGALTPGAKADENPSKSMVMYRWSVFLINAVSLLFKILLKVSHSKLET